MIESVNVTSLGRYTRQGMFRADIVCLQETKLTHAGQSTMATVARSMGWRALRGAPLESTGGGGGG